MNTNLLPIILFILLLPTISAQVTNKTITGEVITGENIEEELNLTIQIRGPPPINIISPRNGIYLTNNIFLDFTIEEFEGIIFNIDEQTNLSITEPLNFFISDGVHKINIYVKTTQEDYFQSIRVDVNPGKFEIIYDEYKNTTKGDSTSIEQKNFDELKELNNLILENTNYGKIIFTEEINLINDIDPNDNITNLDLYTNITENEISINTSMLPNLNKSAILTLYDLPFSNPILMKDNGTCPITLCEKMGYSNNDLTFKVQGFSKYYAIEGPPLPSGGSPKKETSSGGGGGDSSVPTNITVVTPERIQEKMKQGEIKTKKITIKNTQNRRIKVKINSNKLSEILIPIEEEITLEANERKEISIDFVAREDTIPDLYLGAIKIEALGETKTIWVAIEIESKNSLFDAYLKIFNKKTITPGDTLLVHSELFNLGETKRVDATLEYAIKDLDGNLISKIEKTVAVQTKIELLEDIDLPEDIEIGEYIIYLKVDYEGRVAIASEKFQVEGKEIFQIPYNLIISIFIIILIATIIFIIIKRRKQKKRLFKRKRFQVSRKINIFKNRFNLRR